MKWIALISAIGWAAIIVLLIVLNIGSPVFVATYVAIVLAGALYRLTHPRAAQ